jgi:hypothetical protein
MKRLNIVHALVVAAFATAGLDLRAQDPDAVVDLGAALPVGGVYVGVTGALSHNIHSGGFRLFSAGNGQVDGCGCATFEDGAGDGGQAGLAARLQVAPVLAIDARVTYDSRPGHFVVQLPEAVLVDASGNELLRQTVRASSDVEYKLITVEALATLNAFKIIPGLFVTLSAGPSLGIVQDGKIDQYQDLIEPQNGRFVNPDGYPTENEGRRMYFLRHTNIPEMNGTRLSAKGGAGIDAHLFDALIVRGGVYFDYGLTDLTEAENWRVNSTLYQLDILVAL